MREFFRVIWKWSIDQSWTRLRECGSLHVTKVHIHENLILLFFLNNYIIIFRRITFKCSPTAFQHNYQLQWPLFIIVIKVFFQPMSWQHCSPQKFVLNQIKSNLCHSFSTRRCISKLCWSVGSNENHPYCGEIRQDPSVRCILPLYERPANASLVISLGLFRQEHTLSLHCLLVLPIPFQVAAQSWRPRRLMALPLPKVYAKRSMLRYTKSNSQILVTNPRWSLFKVFFFWFWPWIPFWPCTVGDRPDSSTSRV